ncbi:MAG: hypothetical protein PUP91_27725 [Rhizonema sp. PD37]|nr:hypothetical protein [Rhizonema sp. PD37]
MHMITGGTQNRNIIGQRYKVLSNNNQTPDWQDLVTNTHNLKIEISIESPFSSEFSNQLNQNSELLVKCLTLLSLLLVTSSAGLQEASETLENIVEYYRDSMSDLQQTTLPHELKVTKGNIVSSVTRPPLVIDLD